MLFKDSAGALSKAVSVPSVIAKHSIVILGNFPEGSIGYEHPACAQIYGADGIVTGVYEQSVLCSDHGKDTVFEAGKRSADSAKPSVIGKQGLVGS